MSGTDDGLKLKNYEVLESSGINFGKSRLSKLMYTYHHRMFQKIRANGADLLILCVGVPRVELEGHACALLHTCAAVQLTLMLRWPWL